ncbi:MAG TPA: DJ-1 family glyoxalase III [Candidatus Omnitrophota bacterium]|nr:DJ-1 family glyoxalase III [Candidatus Omnitrophota bacterium]
MKKTVVIVLADGFEEIEAVTPIDILRRAGLEVIVAGVGKREVTGSHGITVETDIMIEQYQEMPDAVVLPGGMPGSENLKKSAALEDLLQKMKRSNRTIGAICAAPAVVLAAQGILDGKKATCYPGFENEFGSKVVFQDDRVVRDGQITTSRGPGTALEFSLELVSQLVSPEAAKKVSQSVLAKPS